MQGSLLTVKKHGMKNKKNKKIAAQREKKVNGREGASSAAAALYAKDCGWLFFVQ